MFMPCIGYYNCSLAGLPASTLAPFPLVQISAAKLILDWSWTISHRLCATKTSLATIHIMFKVATVMHSIFLCSPLYLSKLFAYCIDESRWHCLQSLSTRSIIVCWRRTQFGRCSFSVLGWMSEMGLPPEQIPIDEHSKPIFLWSPYVIGQTIIFSSCFFFFFFFYFLA